MHKTQIEVRYGETDKMGIVYHANYFCWFEVARNRWSKDNKIDYAKLEEKGIMMPLTDCGCKFIKSAVFGDTVVVETSVSALSVVRCKFDFKVYSKADKSLLAYGYTTHAFTNTDLKPINLKKHYFDVYDVFEKSYVASQIDEKQ